MMSASRPPGPLPSTLWSEVRSAGRGSSRALETLSRRYMAPVYAFLRMSGQKPENADDLCQAFFLFMLETGVIGKADPERGRFRHFLLACLRNFLKHEHRRETRLKRGGGQKPLSLNVEDAEHILRVSSEEEDPAAHFHRQWATGVFTRALEKLVERTGEKAMTAFRMAHGSQALPHAEIGAKLDMSENAIATAVSRTRRVLRDLLVEEVRETVSSEGDVESELRDLFQSFSASEFPGDLL